MALLGVMLPSPAVGASGPAAPAGGIVFAASPDLECGAAAPGDHDVAWWRGVAGDPYGSCATFVSVGTTLFGPAHVPGADQGSAVASSIPRTVVTPVRQTRISGAGTTS